MISSMYSYIGQVDRAPPVPASAPAPLQTVKGQPIATEYPSLGALTPQQTQDVSTYTRQHYVKGLGTGALALVGAGAVVAALFYFGR